LERCAPVLRITVPQKCGESGFRSLPNARIPWATRKCYVSSFSSLRPLIQTRCFDVTNGPDLEVKGFVKGAQGAFKCSLSLPCEVWLRQFSRCNFFIPPQFNSKRAPLRVHTGGQNGDAIRAVPAKYRVANTEHEPLAFEC